LTGDERFRSRQRHMERVLSTLQQSRLKYHQLFRQHGCRVSELSWTYQITRSPAHAYGQSKLLIMELCSYPQTRSEWNDPLVSKIKIYHLRLTNRYSERTCPAISTTYGVLKSNPILPPEAIKAGPPRRRVTYHNL
jgi:hypothetical protein